MPSTQPDPIGLAGGLNRCGFANGDPVNYSDPFGLDCRLSNGQKCPVSAVERAAATAARAMGKAGQAVFDYLGKYPEVQQALVEMPLGMSARGSGLRVRAGVGTRYMGPREARSVANSRGTIPATYEDGTPRVIHYTTDAPTMSAQAAKERYNLGAPPTHVCQFPLCNVQNNVPPTGSVAPGATQAATSMPIHGASDPVPLNP